MKILAVGDSFTAGAELPDIYGKHFSATSGLCYPQLLGKMYNAQVVNLSMGGGSNGRIFRKVIEELSARSYDLLICGWTSIERLDLSYQGIEIPSTLNEYTMEKIPWIKDYYAWNHDYLILTQTYLSQIIAIQSYLKYNNQKYIFVGVFPVWDWALDYYKNICDQVDKNYFIGWPNFGLLDFMGDCPKGPGGHPLELGHQRIAEKINEHIRNLGWVS